jgi:hypothetical protein
MTIPWNPTLPADDQCKQAILNLVKGAPSDWGIMVDDYLLSFEKDDLVDAQFHGPEAFITFRMKASFEVQGYRAGDVLFAVNIGTKGELEKVPPRGQFKEVSLLGLPFQLCAQTQLNVEKLNIMIDHAEMEGGLTYYARPCYYPHYAPLVASLASMSIEEAPFYSGVATPPTVLKMNQPLLDPLAGLTDLGRKKRIVADIRRMLSIGSGTVPIIGIDIAFGSPPAKTRPTIPKGTKVLIEFMPMKEIRKKKADTTDYDFIYVPSIPLFKDTVAMVTWYETKHQPPTTKQLDVFERAVDQYIKMKQMEAESLAEIFPTEKKVKEEEQQLVALREEWLKTSDALLTKTTPIETTKIPPPMKPSSSVASEKPKARGRKKVKSDAVATTATTSSTSSTSSTASSSSTSSTTTTVGEDELQVEDD